MNRRSWMIIIPGLVAAAVCLWFMLRKDGPPSGERAVTPRDESGLISPSEPENEKPLSPINIEERALPAADREDNPTTDVLTGVSADISNSTDTALLKIFGVVSSHDGTPLPVAQLAAFPLERQRGPRPGPLAAGTSSGEGGHYQLFVPRGSDYLVAARADGHAAVMLPAPSPRGAREVRLDIRLNPAALISGIVREPDGKPIPGAVIMPSRSEEPDEEQGFFRAFAAGIPPSFLKTAAGADGRFVLHGLDPGDHDLCAEKEGFTPAVKTRVTAPSENVEIVMERGEGGLIAGHVFYLSGGQAASGAEVSIVSQPFMPNPSTVKCGSDGAFQFAGLIPGIYEITARKDSLENMPHPEIDIRSIHQKSDVVLKLFEGYVISGMIYEQGGANPVADVEVTANTARSFGQGGGGLTARSDDKGHYEIRGVPERTVFLMAELEGWFQAGSWGPGSPIRLELPRDRAEAGNIDIPMSRGVRVSGRVLTGENTPVPGADVRFVTEAQLFRRERQPMKSDSEGSFSGYVHNNTRMTVQASHENYADGATNPILVNDRPVEDVIVRMDAGGTARGVVLTPDEEPVPGAQVRGSSPTASTSFRGRNIAQRSIFADGAGRFIIERVPAGEYYLHATAEGYNQSERVMVRVPENGESAEARLVLTSPHFLAGFVRDADGNAMAGARVAARSARRQARVAYSLADGSFRIGNLSSGRYTLQATRGNTASPNVEADTNTADVELILSEQQTASLSGVVLNSITGEPVQSFSLRDGRGRTVYGEFYDPEGRFHVENLVRGRNYHFNIISPGFVTTLSPPVGIPREGDVPDVTFRIGLGGSILGRVIEIVDGKGVPGTAKVTWFRQRRLRADVFEDQVMFSDENGIFLIEGLSPERYILRIERFPYSPIVVEVNVKDGEMTDLGDLYFKNSCSIKGRVLGFGEEHPPVPDKVVRLNSQENPLPVNLSYKTGPEGYYTFTGIPAGKYVIRPVGSEYRAETVTLKSGQNLDLDFLPHSH